MRPFFPAALLTAVLIPAAGPTAAPQDGRAANPGDKAVASWDASGRVAVVSDQDCPVQLQGGTAKNPGAPIMILARNLSDKKVRSVTVAAILPSAPARPDSPIVRVVGRRPSKAPANQGEFFLLETGLVAEKTLRSAPKGSIVRFGVTDVVFSDGSTWTYDVVARGGFASTPESRARSVAGAGQSVRQLGTKGCINPAPLYPMDPQYTEAAEHAQMAGDVEIDADVLSNGLVGEVRITKSLDTKYGLDQQAVAAAKGWLFDPARCNGAPVAMTVGLIIEFRLH